MTAGEFLTSLRDALDGAQVPYMLVGSFASTTYGKPRGTNDVDIVIAPAREALVAFMRRLPKPQYYADEEDALRALQQHDMFNIMEDFWKADFYICKRDPYSLTAFGRRRLLTVEGTEMYVASAEDVVISKMQWSKMGGSERQIEDAAGIVRLRSGELDLPYVERWARELQLGDQWRAVQERAL